MIPLLRPALRAIVPGPVTTPRSDELLQESLGGCPWRVAIASMLLCRTSRKQAEPALHRLLCDWTAPEFLCRANEHAVVHAIRGCGLHRKRSKQLIRFSSMWLGDGWEDLRELPGVGVYVADAVGLVCFGCTELESSDGALCARSSQIGAGASRIA